jgi:hypothetical protein
LHLFYTFNSLFLVLLHFPIFLFLFSYFSPKWHLLISPEGGGDIFQYNRPLYFSLSIQVYRSQQGTIKLHVAIYWYLFPVRFLSKLPVVQKSTAVMCRLVTSCLPLEARTRQPSCGPGTSGSLPCSGVTKGVSGAASSAPQTGHLQAFQLVWCPCSI